MGAAVVSCCNAPPIFEFGEHVLDLVAASVEVFVIGQFHLAVLFGGDARFDAAHYEGGAEPVAVIALIGDQA